MNIIIFIVLLLISFPCIIFSYYSSKRNCNKLFLYSNNNDNNLIVKKYVDNFNENIKNSIKSLIILVPSIAVADSSSSSSSTSSTTSSSSQAIGYKAAQSVFAPSSPLLVVPLLPQSALLNSLPLKNVLVGQLQGYLESFIGLTNPSGSINLKNQIQQPNSVLWNNLRINAQRAAGMFIYNREGLLPPKINDEDPTLQDQRQLYGNRYLNELQISVLSLVNASRSSDTSNSLRYMRSSLTLLSKVAYVLVPLDLTSTNSNALERESANIKSPRLLGRCIVQLNFQKRESTRKTQSSNSNSNSKSNKNKSNKNNNNIESNNKNINTVKLVVDGLNHPIASGSFIDLVERGFYDNSAVEEDTFEYLGQSCKRILCCNSKYEEPLTGEIRRLPLEILREGEFNENGVLGSRFTATGSAKNSAVFTRSPPVLSFATLGAIGLNHQVGDPNGGSAGFFWVRTKKDSSLSEIHSSSNIQRLNSRYTLFAHIIEGLEVFQQLKPGDILSSVEVEDGLWSLLRSSSSSS